MITLKDIFDKMGYGNYGEFAVSGYGKEFNIHFTQEITSYESKVDEVIFWSIVLNPEFCKKVFGDEIYSRYIDDFYPHKFKYVEKKNWEFCQFKLLEMRNENKTIDEVLEYIEYNTILEFPRTLKNPTDVVGKMNWTETE